MRSLVALPYNFRAMLYRVCAVSRLQRKKKQEEYNRLQRERNKQKELSDKLTCENSAIDN
jgi:hypothetical protein